MLAGALAAAGLAGASVAPGLMSGTPALAQPPPAAGPYSGSPKGSASQLTTRDYWDMGKDAVMGASHASGMAGQMRGRNAKAYLDEAHPGTSPGERIASGQRDPGSTADPEMQSIQRAHEARLAGMEAHSTILSSLSGRVKEKYAARALEMYGPMIDMTPEEALETTDYGRELEVQSRGQAHDVGMQARGQVHDVGMQSRGQAHDVGMQARGQAHDVGMQSRAHAHEGYHSERDRLKDLTIAQGAQDLGHREAATGERSAEAAALGYLGRTGRAAQQMMYDTWSGVLDAYEGLTSYTEIFEAEYPKADRQALQDAFGPAEMIGAGGAGARMLGRSLRGGPPPVPRSRPAQPRDQVFPDYPRSGSVRDRKTGRYQGNPNRVRN